MRTTPTLTTNRDSSAWELIVFVLVTFVILLLLAFWPITKQFIAGLADPPVVKTMGKVQAIRYVGGVSNRTQVTTSAGTLLLIRAVEIPIAAEVERRSTLVSDLLCLVGTDLCFKIASEPVAVNGQGQTP